MKSVCDWFFSQLMSSSLVSSRPLSGRDIFLNEEQLNEDHDAQGTARSVSSVVALPSQNASSPSNGNQENQSQLYFQQGLIDYSEQSDHGSIAKKMSPFVNIEDLQVKFMRLLQRLGLSPNNHLAVKVLYRIHLATLIGAGESDLKRINMQSDWARALATEQEAAGIPELDFSIRILVLGKTGVGKSATINSIFDQNKTVTDAFRPATDRIQEVIGMINGIKVTFIDTPGLLPPSAINIRRNKKILHSLKKFIRKSPPDIVLYFERLDLINIDYNDFPLLRLITEVFGTAIWFNTIFVMTHSFSTLPEGEDLFPVRYESYVSNCSDLLQHYIHEVVSDSRLENPLILVENHPECPKNILGEKILPNGQVWKSQFLLSCICGKVLNDVNVILNLQGSIELGPLSFTRTPSLPHLLSSLLRRHLALTSPGEVDDEIAENLFSGVEEEDEYERLPPIRILTKSQFERLTKSQRKEYLDELDYRETLFLKKQMKEEYHRQRHKRLFNGELLADENNYDSKQASPEAVLLPDMLIPSSFDSDCPVHRYRCLVSSDQWLVRPVLDPRGWDHDVNFDGVSVETAFEMNHNIIASVTGQMSKDKKDFSIQSECAAAYFDPAGTTYSVGLDVQSAGKDFIYTLHSNTKLRKLWHNITNCGVSLTSFGNKPYIGAKVEDSISLGNRLKFVVNAGGMGDRGQVAYGGSVEATVRGIDYPVKNDFASLTMTVLSFNKEVVLGGSLQSEFRPTRNMKVSVNANLNSRKMGQICFKASSSEHLQIGLIAAFTIFKVFSRRKSFDSLSQEGIESR